MNKGGKARLQECNTLLVVHPTSMVLQSYFTSTSPVLDGTSFVLHLYFTGTSSVLHLYFTDTLSVLHWYFAVVHDISVFILIPRTPVVYIKIFMNAK